MPGMVMSIILPGDFSKCEWIFFICICFRVWFSKIISRAMKCRDQVLPEKCLVSVQSMKSNFKLFVCIFLRQLFPNKCPDFCPEFWRTFLSTWSNFSLRSFIFSTVSIMYQRTILLSTISCFGRLNRSPSEQSSFFRWRSWTFHLILLNAARSYEVWKIVWGNNYN